MPLYEYECESCGHRFERIQKFSDPLIDQCPSCAGGVRKLLSSPAIQFKGSGWYITDYARKSGNDSGASSKDTKDAKEAGKTDTGGSTSDSSSSSTSPAAPSTTKSD